MVNTPKKYRVGKVKVEAMHFDGSNTDAIAVYQWVEREGPGSFDVNYPTEHVPLNGVSIDASNGKMVICTSEGIVPVNLGDYVVKGPDGNFYPLRSKVFHSKFVEV